MNWQAGFRIQTYFNKMRFHLVVNEKSWYPVLFLLTDR